MDIVKTGSIWVLRTAPILDVNGARLAGLTDIKCSVSRLTSGVWQWLDTADATFRAVPAGYQYTMTAVDATKAAGVYAYALDFASVTNAVLGDQIFIDIQQTSLTNAINANQAGGGVYGYVVDKVEANLTVATSTLATAAALATVQADTDDIQTRLPAALVAGRIDASVGAMATDTLTAAALAADAVTEIQAGLATSADIAGIGTATGAALSQDAATDNYLGGIPGVTSATTKVGTETGTYANTSALDGVYHVITHTANTLDIVYQFLTGGGTSPVGCTWTGYLTSGNDTATIYAWRHDTGAWEQVGTIAGQGGTTNIVKTIALFSRHAGTSAAELGKVYVRIQCTGTSPVLNTDQILASYAVTSRTVGYANGAVWLDTGGSNTSTEAFVSGTADNPVSTLAAALTIAAAVGLHDITSANGSTVTLASTVTNKTFIGDGWTLALGGQAAAGCKFIGASNGVSGTVTGAGIFFYECSIINATTPPATFQTCGLRGTLTVGSAGDYFLIDCFSQLAGGTPPVIDLAAVGATNFSIRRWSGALTVNNIGAGDVLAIEVVSAGAITLNGVGGTVSVRGTCNVVDNRTGSPTLTQTAVLNQTVLATPTNITALGADIIGAAQIAPGAIGASEAPLLGTINTAVGLTATSAALATMQDNVTTILGYGAPPSAVDIGTQVWATAYGTPSANTFGWLTWRLAQWGTEIADKAIVGQLLVLRSLDLATTYASVTLRDKDGGLITPATGEPARFDP